MLGVVEIGGAAVLAPPQFLAVTGRPYDQIVVEDQRLQPAVGREARMIVGGHAQIAHHAEAAWAAGVVGRDDGADRLDERAAIDSVVIADREADGGSIGRIGEMLEGQAQGRDRLARHLAQRGAKVAASKAGPWRGWPHRHRHRQRRSRPPPSCDSGNAARPRPIRRERRCRGSAIAIARGAPGIWRYGRAPTVPRPASWSATGLG